MPENVRALIVVLALAVPAFYVGRQLAASLITPREFAVWRNAWFAVTVAAFLSGSFFVFAAIETMICFYVRRARAATSALFVVLLLAVPLVDLPISGFGVVNWLLDINNARLLAIVLLLPTMLAMGGSGRLNRGVYSMPDGLIVAYALLIGVNSESVEQFLRLVTQSSLDVLIPYFAFSRLVTSVADLRRVFLALIISALPMSLIGIFETAKGWLLYASFVYDWRGDVMFRYLFREDMLRANASAGGSIVLGFVIMVAIGCVLALWQSIGSRRSLGIALAILSAGLIACLSRGPWVGAAVLVLVYLVTSTNALANLVRLVVVGAIVLLPLLLTPVGDRLLAFVPFTGSVDAGTVEYRQRLFDAAIPVIERNPWFGSRNFLLTPEMQEMIQGQHMVDLVNSYLAIALNSGLVGLGVFLAFFGTILIGLRRVLKFEVVRKTSLQAYTSASAATLVAVMVTIGTTSSVDFVPYVYWSFAGLCVALIRIAYKERAAVPHAARVPA